MKTVLNLGSAILLANTAVAVAQDISVHLAHAFPLIVFTDTPENDFYVSQINELKTIREDMLDKDVILYLDDNPSNNTSLRTRFEPEGFLFVLIGKDGELKLRQSVTVPATELLSVIDGENN